MGASSWILTVTPSFRHFITPLSPLCSPSLSTSPSCPSSEAPSRALAFSPARWTTSRPPHSPSVSHCSPRLLPPGPGCLVLPALLLCCTHSKGTVLPEPRDMLSATVREPSSWIQSSALPRAPFLVPRPLLIPVHSSQPQTHCPESARSALHPLLTSYGAGCGFLPGPANITPCNRPCFHSDPLSHTLLTQLTGTSCDSPTFFLLSITGLLPSALPLAPTPANSTPDTVVLSLDLHRALGTAVHLAFSCPLYQASLSQMLFSVSHPVCPFLQRGILSSVLCSHVHNPNSLHSPSPCASALLLKRPQLQDHHALPPTGWR
nr:PREDICTED: uncharacterized protein LOC109457936 [Rhinolophus sinicus]